MSEHVRLFFDRQPGSIHGLLTILEIDEHGQARDIVRRVKARSGQAGHTKTSWTRGVSPIPFSHEVENEYRLYLTPQNVGQKAGQRGIGEFWAISTEPDKVTTKRKGLKQVRLYLGLHPENGLPGSAGCIVVVFESDWRVISEYLHHLKDKGIESVEVIVL